MREQRKRKRWSGLSSADIVWLGHLERHRLNLLVVRLFQDRVRTPMQIEYLRRRVQLVVDRIQDIGEKMARIYQESLKVPFPSEAEIFSKLKYRVGQIELLQMSWTVRYIDTNEEFELMVPHFELPKQVEPIDRIVHHDTDEDFESLVPLSPKQDVNPKSDDEKPIGRDGEGTPCGDAKQHGVDKDVDKLDNESNYEEELIYYFRKLAKRPEKKPRPGLKEFPCKICHRSYWGTKSNIRHLEEPLHQQLFQEIVDSKNLDALSEWQRKRGQKSRREFVEEARARNRKTFEDLVKAGCI